MSWDELRRPDRRSVVKSWQKLSSDELRRMKKLRRAEKRRVHMCREYVRKAQGACPICLAGWRADDSVLVLSCNHVLHVDCFWKMITAAGSDALRGRCRVCRAPVHWGPVARSNLRCILASALAAALVRQQQAGGGLSQSDVAEYCSRVSEEIGESFHDIWTEVPYQLLKVKQKVLPNSEMANLQRLFSTPFLR
eukprot:s5514_g3.t1